MTARLADGEPLTSRWAFATALACTGVLLLVLGGGSASVDPLGVALAVVSGTGYATYTVLAKRVLRLGHAPERVMAASFSLGAVLLLPVIILGDMSWIASTDGLLMALFLGAVRPRSRTSFRPRAAVADTGGDRDADAAEPLTATGLGVLALGEQPGAVAAVGAACVAGLLALAAGPRRAGASGSFRPRRAHDRAARPRRGVAVPSRPRAREARR